VIIGDSPAASCQHPRALAQLRGQAIAQRPGAPGHPLRRVRLRQPEDGRDRPLVELVLVAAGDRLLMLDAQRAVALGEEGADLGEQGLAFRVVVRRRQVDRKRPASTVLPSPR
jgi:hypothetical protein